MSGYNIYYGNYSNFKYSNSINVGNTTSYEMGATYSISDIFAVTVYNDNADGNDDIVEGYESWYTIADTPPEAPTNFSALGRNGSVILTWTASTSDGVTGYEIYRDLSSNNIDTKIATVSSDVLTFTDTGLTNGTTYHYSLKAIKSGGLASAFSVNVQSTPGSAAILHVNQNGTGVSTTIQGAIDMSIDGDTILVAEGIYYENLTLLDKKLHLASHYLTTGDTSKISNTVLSIYASNVPGISMTASNSNNKIGKVTVTGLVIRGAQNWAISGGALLVNNYQSFALNNCVIRDNQAFHGGGLYSWDTDSIMIHNSLFTANYASEHGGGMRIGGRGASLKLVIP